MFEAFQGQFEAALVAQACVTGLQFFQNSCVVGRIDHNCNIGMVFCGGADHGRATNVDVFDRGLQIAIRLGDGLFEGVKIDDDHVDRSDSVCCHHRVIDSAAAQDAAVHFWMQGFHPAVHHFRKTRVIRYFGDGYIMFGQQFRGTAGGEQFDSQAVQAAAKLENAGFIGDADQRTGHFFVHANLKKGKKKMLTDAVMVELFAQGAAAQTQNNCGFALVEIAMFQCGFQ